MEMPTAVSHRHRFVRVSFPLAIFEGSGFPLVSRANCRGMPAARITRVVPESECAFGAVFRAFDEKANSGAGQFERAFNQFDRYRPVGQDEIFWLSNPREKILENLKHCLFR
jgi:hypothetical protein